MSPPSGAPAPLPHLLRVLAVTALLAAAGPGAAHAQRPGPDRPRTAPVAPDRPARLALADTLARRADAVEAATRLTAARLALPVRTVRADGAPVLLARFERGRPRYLTPLNFEAAITTRTSLLHPGGALGLALTGADLEIGVWDGGHVLAGHRELAGRVATPDNAPADAHATHVGGTLIATGLDFRARGMAFRALLRSYDFERDEAEMAQEAARGMLLSNHSYGLIAGWYFGDVEDRGTDQWYWFGDPDVSPTEDPAFGRYDESAAQWDRISFLNPYYLPVVAVGNDRGDEGTDTQAFRVFVNGAWRTFLPGQFRPPPDGSPGGFDSIAGAAVAKNVLAVGSVGDRLSPLLPAAASFFSSFGPTDDGRIKPDLMGNGDRLYSSLSGSPSAYGIQSGTSMAAPNVTGSLLLLQEHFRNLTDRFMRAATLRGLALHTADDAGAPGPDYRYGWGVLDAEAAAVHLSTMPANGLAVVEATLAGGTTFSRQATLDGRGPVRITLAWSDPSAAPAPLTVDDPQPRLVHDLDLRLVHDETGAVYRPYVLDPSDPSAPAATGDNVRDNVEQVYVADAPAGTYTVRVSHKRVLSGVAEQPFSLLVSGAVDRQRVVSVANFRAVAELDSVVLSWRTLTELGEGNLCVSRVAVTLLPGGDRTLGEPLPVGTVPLVGSPADTTSYAFVDPFVPSGEYLYRLAYAPPNVACAAAPLFAEVEIRVEVPRPGVLGVVSNFPNPFSERTTIVIDLPATWAVQVEVYDLLGRRVATLLDGPISAGRFTLPIETSSWTPGLYFLRVTTPEGAVSRTMVRR